MTARQSIDQDKVAGALDKVVVGAQHFAVVAAAADAAVDRSKPDYPLAIECLECWDSLAVADFASLVGSAPFVEEASENYSD